MQLFVFAHESIRSKISNIEMSNENTGFLHIFPNKGGICVSFRVLDTSVALVSSHLTAHEVCEGK